MEYDVIVIGAGPAGSRFSKLVAEAGMKVVMLEKKKELGTPVRCGEGITTHWETDLDLDFNEKSVAQEIFGIEVFAPNGHAIRIKTLNSTGVVLERKVFDKQLAMAAGRAGADIVPHCLVTGLLKEGGAVVGVKALNYGEEKEFRAPLIVSAEGMEAKIARELGFKAMSTLHSVGTCIEYEMVNVDCSEQLIEVYFGDAYAPRGYVWIFPKGKDIANVGIGIGGDTGADPKKFLDKFIADRPARFGNAKTVEVKGGIISVSAPQKELVKDGAMIIGTVAHQVDPIHGGGIGLAIEAGNYAAKTAIEAWKKKDYSVTSLKDYEESWWEKRGKKMEKRLKLRRLLEKLSDDDFSVLLETINSDDLDSILKGDYAKVIGQAARFGKVFFKKPHLMGLLKDLI